MTTPVEPGERQLVRQAVASYFGGSLVTTDTGIAYQGGPLTSSGLGTAYPYRPKGVPDSYYTKGMPPGHGWGAIMAVSAFTRQRQRESLGGFFDHWYNVTCTLAVISQERHVEAAESGTDGLLDAMLARLYADPSLGTTTGSGRLITQAGENPFGSATSGMAGKDEAPAFQPLLNPATGELDQRGRWLGEASFQFWALVSVFVPPPAAY